jgi:hypothetical protein
MKMHRPRELGSKPLMAAAGLGVLLGLLTATTSPAAPLVKGITRDGIASDAAAQLPSTSRAPLEALDGTWTIFMRTPLGTHTAMLTLSTAGGTLTGVLWGNGQATKIADGAIDGDQASWKADITDPMAITLEFSAKIQGDKLSGIVKLGMFGDAPLSGTRV